MPPADTCSDGPPRKDRPAKPYRLADRDGLALPVTPKGRKWCRLRHRFEGPEQMLSLGVRPEVPLKEARVRRDAARKIVTAGGDPSRVRQEERDARAPTFEDQREGAGPPGTRVCTAGSLGR